MGYTHYWTIKEGLSAKEFSDLGEYSQKVINKTTATICGGDGTGKPVITNTEICLNGTEEDRLDHETFCIRTEDRNFNFCKTAEKPYDEAVTAILWYIHKNHSRKIEVSSDGDMDGFDWKAGKDIHDGIQGPDKPAGIFDGIVLLDK